MKIRVNEFKYKVLNGVENLIDVYFSPNSITDRFINATVKIIVNQNVDKLDDFIVLFADKDGFIDTDVIIKEYGKAFGTDKLIIDLRDFVNNDIVRRALPNKAIAIELNDLAKIFEDK
jgi:c-di-GMP-related signal transduction protein